MKIAVLVPCYNEELTIGNVIEDFKNVIPEADIYVYDNNSTDRTALIAKEKGAIVIPEYRQGKGNVVRSMFRQIEADCYIMVDGDDTYPAKDALRLAKLIIDGKADMAIGDRLSSTYFTENKRAFHNFGNKLVRLLINKIFKNEIKDIMTGCRAFSRRFVKSFPVLSNGFEIETEMSIHALDKRFLISEIPISYRDRPEGSESKLSTFSDGYKVLKTILKLYKDYKPMSFFGFVSLLFFIISGLMFVPILVEYLNTGLVARFPTLIVSVGLGVAALLSLVCGLILDTVKKHSDQFYELELNRIESEERN
ncbi:MAG: glycosyltransferase family 2 protein [Clostridium sp.]|uniref:glycosyltransferase family 2 protein n=1 Tax=Clostridium TaxID=1485 RepID=UPI00232ED9D2|nr:MULTISPECIES: glycosyltransferase family 2 protein [Clostridium]MDB2106225.1 glycosyltransferase family 2 protein [Clostridium paraputrificum]MDB2112916.1 glycosyltransferase family 2 protein [Clostridium paraputrificum]MDU3411329.1 glycosyltransferase family 2 protein [Clostridium sp.]MDU4789063.1 glycosyltransferase family 2 protein [Clostridium sp.]MDU6807972.1 glycosyltransferase family 2 protein [Clostridium sp.]